MTSPSIVRVVVNPGPAIVRVIAPGPTGPSPTVPVYALTKLSPVAGAVTIPFNAGSTVRLLLTGNVTTMTFSGLPGTDFCQRLVLYVKQDDVGGRTISWPASIKWPGDAIPSLSSAANSIDCFVIDSLEGDIIAALGAADFR